MTDPVVVTRTTAERVALVATGAACAVVATVMLSAALGWSDSTSPLVWVGALVPMLVGLVMTGFRSTRLVGIGALLGVPVAFAVLVVVFVLTFSDI